MEKSVPSRLDNARQLASQLLASAQLDVEIVSILEDYHHSIYALQQDYRLLRASNDSLKSELSQMRTKYSEAVYLIKELKQQLRDL